MTLGTAEREARSMVEKAPVTFEGACCTNRVLVEIGVLKMLVVRAQKGKRSIVLEMGEKSDSSYTVAENWLSCVLRCVENRTWKW